jgi:quercetin dioxygenase-like cupin family protein
MQRMLHLALTFFALFCMAGQPVTMAQESKKPAHKAGSAKSSSKKPVTNAFTPDSIQYGPAPAFLPPGAQLAVLEGNPMGTGEYTIRIKAPDGYKIAPHWHPRRENVTVVEGTIKVGMGDKFDESKMMSFPTGSFAFLDPSMHHYAMMSGETTVQIHGTGPVKFNYINPADDPSKKK